MRKIRVLVMLSLFILSAPSALSTEQYAKRSGKSCAFCHEGPNGGPLNTVGVAYIRNGYKTPIPERILDKTQRIMTPFHQALRLIIKYIHLVAACIFVGAIFYVHLFIKPAKLTGGIPSGEKKLGLVCMATLTITGSLLTVYRIDSFSGFFASHFGILLFIKICLFILMAVLAVAAVTLVHRKMQEESTRPVQTGTGAFNIQDLSRYDGKEGRPAYVLYKGTVYDVSESARWKEGSHFRKHAAGKDLTQDMAGAPHGDEVFSRFPVVARVESGPSEEKISATRKVYIVMAYANLILVFLILLIVSSWMLGFAVTPSKGLTGEKNRQSQACLDCHNNYTPGIISDWRRSMHGKVGTNCSDCHVQQDSSAFVSLSHLARTGVRVSALVTPGRCNVCHPQETEEYARSKHAHTRAITEAVDKWLIHGTNNDIERTSGCFACHGTEVQFIDGKPVPGTWPNVGVGRANPDGTLGSCTSCHTRHRFSLAEARKPEACGQCHLGPDHPQIEIYEESKHGALYHAEGSQWNWRTDDHRWLAGRDYRAPTCATCHMSEADSVPRSHDVTERLSWELQAPLTIRPEEFAAFPARTQWAVEREKMRRVCSQCHTEEWIQGHFRNMDDAIANYNDLYYHPMNRAMNELYDKGLLTRNMYFDEAIEWEFYEFWHHEGRRARMGAAMMAPDYAWWHGFYELKHRFTVLTEAIHAIKASGGSAKIRFPGTKK